MMFEASPGYMLVEADYSQQEPRCLTGFSRDEHLLEAYRNDRDLYATLGAGVYKNDYWDNMEHYEDGTPNVEGKKRRKKMKTLLLGMMYGMGPNLLSENMGVSLDEANKIIKDFHDGFPQVSEWMKKTEEDACRTGYVEDFWGRRRRLPDLLLPEYSFAFKGNNLFNPLLGSAGRYENTALIDKYKAKLETAKFNDYEKIKKEADAEGLTITKNGGFISRAKRQCTNARIQGSASSMTKIAMIAIENDPVMKEIDFKLLIGVHDELIGECPEEYAEKGAERLTYLMKNCVPELGVPLKCDPAIEKHWYEEEYQKQLKNEYEKGSSFDEICADHTESTREQIAEYLK